MHNTDCSIELCFIECTNLQGHRNTGSLAGRKVSPPPYNEAMNSIIDLIVNINTVYNDQSPCCMCVCVRTGHHAQALCSGTHVRHSMVPCHALSDTPIMVANLHDNQNRSTQGTVVSMRTAYFQSAYIICNSAI